jgi:hypothetical protein
MAAWSALTNPKTAATSGITAAKISAPDGTVSKYGKIVSDRLGTAENPGKINYGPVTNPLSRSDIGNSNTAAYAVADAASEEAGSGEQKVPTGSNPIGWRQADKVFDIDSMGITGTRAKGSRICPERDASNTC